MAARSEPLAGSQNPATRAPRHIELTETKHASKTTEFYAMIAIIAGILISAWWIGRDGSPDLFRADRAWLSSPSSPPPTWSPWPRQVRQP